LKYIQTVEQMENMQNFMQFTNLQSAARDFYRATQLC